MTSAFQNYLKFENQTYFGKWTVPYSAHLHFAAADRVHVISEVRRLLTKTFIKSEVPI